MKRGYQSDGTLVPRNQKGALIKDEEQAVKRVIRMVRERKVEAVDGRDITIQADSVYVHGDEAKALAFVKKIREGLTEKGIEIKGF
nr:LamB/YcsF family protein [uncultured Clostridium sp.]